MGGSVSKEKVAEIASTKDATYLPPLGPANPVSISRLMTVVSDVLGLLRIRWLRHLLASALQTSMGRATE